MANRFNSIESCSEQTWCGCGLGDTERRISPLVLLSPLVGGVAVAVDGVAAVDDEALAL